MASLPSEERCEFCRLPIRPDDTHGDITMVDDGHGNRAPGVRCRIAQLAPDKGIAIGAELTGRPGSTVTRV
jgi:hypothetical protein